MFSQKFHKVSAYSDNGIISNVRLKFLARNPVSSLDFSVGCWFFRRHISNHRPISSKLYIDHFRLILLKIQLHLHYLPCHILLYIHAPIHAKCFIMVPIFRHRSRWHKLNFPPIVISLYFRNLDDLAYLSNFHFFLRLNSLF